MNKNSPIILAIILLAGIVLLQILFSLDTHTIVPSTFPGTIRPYSDSSDVVESGGKSVVNVDSLTRDGLFLSYQLDKTFAYYYAGVEFINQNYKLIDLSRFSRVKIDIDAGRSSTVRFFILTDEPGFTDRDNSTSWRHLREVLLIRERVDSYVLDLEDFYTPQWWFETYETTEPLLTKNPLTRVIAMKLETGEGEPVDITQHMHIKKIHFYTPIPAIVRYVQIALFVLMLLILAFRFGIMKRVQLGKYKPIVLGNLFDEELESITDYIGENYQNTELSLNHVADACAMHQDKVTALIRQGYGQTFKQYLNRLRLTEAQRLLRSTDRQISEIAFAVGYNSVSHFNRVFKQQFSCTPREFRSE